MRKIFESFRGGVKNRPAELQAVIGLEIETPNYEVVPQGTMKDTLLEIAGDVIKNNQSVNLSRRYLSWLPDIEFDVGSQNPVKMPVYRATNYDEQQVISIKKKLFYESPWSRCKRQSICRHDG